MYTTLPHLQTAIRAQLQKGAVCRVYQESIKACWPNVPDEVRLQKLSQFANQNHWSVTCRQLGNLGVVAEFEKAA